MNPMRSKIHGHAPAGRQRGVAAIEFAFVFTALFLVLYGIVTFGAVMYTQKVVARAAEDGARAVSYLTTPLVANDPRIKGAVYDALAAALVVPVANSGTTASRRTWIESNVTVTITADDPGGTGAVTRAVVAVSYPYSANRLLPSLPLLDTSLWMPDNLKSQAAAALAS